MVKVGINGFGRIGRYLLRVMDLFPNCEVVVINGHKADFANMAYLLKYDSVHGRFKGEVEATENGIRVNGKEIIVTKCENNAWDWGKYGVDIVIETTGLFKKRADLAGHIACGAKKVILAAPGKDVDATIVMGVNDNVYDGAKHDVISAASCTTNCLAPVAKVINDAFGIDHGLMTTVHSYTMTQRILDGSDKKDFRRGRAGAISIVPTSTGAAEAVGKVIPELKGRLSGMAFRIPTPDASLVDFTCEVKRAVTVEEVNAAVKAACDGALHDNLGWCDEPLVSIDFIGDTHGGTFDSTCTAVMNGTMVKLIAWYDNEAGFTHQLARLVKLVASSI